MIRPRVRHALVLGVVLNFCSIMLLPAAEAQQATRLYRIGVLSVSSFDNTTLGKV